MKKILAFALALAMILTCSLALADRLDDIKAAGNLSDEDVQDVTCECDAEVPAEEPAAPTEETDAPAEEAPEAPAANEDKAE